MAITTSSSSSSSSSSPTPPVDPKSGFCAATKTFRSLRPAPAALPLPTLPLSLPSFLLSLLPSPLPSNSHPALIDAATGQAVSFPALLSQFRSLAAALRHRNAVSKGDVAFVLSPARLDLPPLFLALLSLGAAVSPANPAFTPTEISRLVRLSNPTIAFATSAVAAKLPRDLPTILLDSPLFQSFLIPAALSSAADVTVSQSDVAVILYSSGTTGSVKAAALSHRSFIANVSEIRAQRGSAAEPGRTVVGGPMFHTMGLAAVVGTIAAGDTAVLVTGERAGAAEVLRAAAEHGATRMLTAPPVVAAMAKGGEAVRRRLPALESVLSGGAPLHAAVAERFRKTFPSVELAEGYGLTEGGLISASVDRGESCRLGSVGRLAGIIEAKIVDHVSGNALSIGQKGELWIRGPGVMIGYVGDDESNALSFTCDGWLKTGDLCYIDDEGFLYIVDRLKELIKYKGYQVAPTELEHLITCLRGVVEVAVLPYVFDVHVIYLD